MTENLFRPDIAPPQQQFWDWFRAHEAELFDFEVDPERIFDQLAAELHKVHPQLTFEFGPKEQKREFVVSAGGIKNAFPVVSALVSAAPGFDRWRIVAFRPRRPPGNIIEFRGKRIHPENVQFSLLDNGTKAGIYLFIPGFQEDDKDLKQIGYLLLDDVLGEYDVETRLGLIKMFPPETPIQGQRYPFSFLPMHFDELISKLEKRSRKPS
jgi:hypothetical protein